MKKVRPLKIDNFSPFDLYDQFLAKSSIDRFQKILARYEIFKMAMDVPGHIVECGVFKGAGIYTWAKLQEIFKPHNDQSIYGFDFFEQSRKVASKHSGDSKVIYDHAKNWASRKEILKNLKLQGINSNNVKLIAGDVVKTSKEFASKNVGLRISILYLDLDVYEGTLECLQNLYPLVSNGGLVVFDEYAYPQLGESNAVDQYFNGKNLRLKSFPWAKTPTAFLIKSD